MRTFRPYLAITLAPLLISLASAQQSPPPASAPAKSASELLTSAENAFNKGDWQTAVDLFSRFTTEFKGLPGTEETIQRLKPYLAISQARLGNHQEALPLLTELLADNSLDPATRIDLLFFAGLANLQTGNQTTARRHLGEIFSNQNIARDRRMEALILGGMTYVIEKNWQECLAFFQKHTPEIIKYSPEAGARARILQLYATMQLEKWPEATALAQTIFENLDETRQIVTFSSQLIELGTQLSEQDKPHQAITILRMVPTANAIRRMQTARLNEAKSELALANATNNPVRASQITTSIAEMERELKAFAKTPQFDSATRLRLASAYFSIQRIREGCLILDQMVRQMEPDPIVESATASLIRGWMSLERYARSVRTADLYLERLANLPERPNLPEVMFLKAQALEGQFKHKDAAYAYREVAESFPNLPIAAQARFMEAYNILQLEEYQQAGALLDTQLKALEPTDEMWAHVIHWRAMAYYFDQQWEPAKKLFSQYLKTAQSSDINREYIDDSKFRIGYSIFSEANYPEAIKSLENFTTSHPESEWLAEALLTLGDAYAAEGMLEKARNTYSKISPEAPGFHDEAWMKRGKILKAQDDLAGMENLFRKFLEKRPNSPRIAEGLHWLGWIAKRQDKPEEARKIYLQTIAKYGNDKVRPGLEDIFLGLQDLYTHEQKPELEKLLRDKLAQATSSNKNRLQTRLGWALAQLHLANKSLPPQERTKAAHKDLIALAPTIDPKQTAPQILADVGDALAAENQTDTAYKIYEGLRKWWPRSPLRDRAFAGKAFIEMARGNETAALENLNQFERYAVMPKTAPDERGISLIQGELGGKVALAKVELLSEKSPEQAMHLALAIQKTKSMPAEIRADALLAAARLHIQQNNLREALPYFEQVYLLFNRYPEKVATAYLERGETLEKLSLSEQAREVYSELATRQDLAEYKAADIAHRRATALGGIIPPLDSSIGTITPIEK